MQSLEGFEECLFVPGSVVSGDRLQVTCDRQTLTIDLCGMVAPDMRQPFGEEARDHLRSLIEQGDREDGRVRVTLYAIQEDNRDRTVADVFIPRRTQNLGEIHLNSRMTSDGYGWKLKRYAKECPSDFSIAEGQQSAKDKKIGLWADPNAIAPWQWRQEYYKRR
ncbi:thermonuclease family protein [Roseofilum sp. BLCC_M143]|uniref:Thermonuclease family protein n=2 Tax=Roseofilum TaxID=1233426 RepID=A0ABT7BZ18_9CYAN|nr:thermonuclease family protein [Roseofilum casamattae BLCC-M143]